MSSDRRDFLKRLSFLGLGTLIAGTSNAQPTAVQLGESDKSDGEFCFTTTPYLQRIDNSVHTVMVTLSAPAIAWLEILSAKNNT